jgi:leader peptidase (prepilin peptidase)/N-methyltransferase
MSVELNTLNIIIGLFIFAFGVSIGSFLNVVAYRVPQKISLVLPRSFCTHCKKNIPNIKLIPIIGFFLTRGKCSHCKTKISYQYPFVELLSGILTLFVFFKFLTPFDLINIIPYFNNDNSIQFGKFHFNNFVPFFTSLWIIYTGIALSIIDIKHRILPDFITIPGTIIGFAIGALNPELGWLESLIGIAAGAGGLYGISALYKLIRNKVGMGMGDVKYLGFLGAVLGWKGIVFTLFYASITGAIIGIIWGIITKNGLKEAIPFGPFLGFGAFLVSTFGTEIAHYLFG